MGNKINRVTKQKWYIPNEELGKVEIFRSPNLEDIESEYCYYDKESTIQKIENSRLIEQYFNNKYKRAYLPNKWMYRSLAVYMCEKPGSKKFKKIYWEDSLLEKTVYEKVRKKSPTNRTEKIDCYEYKEISREKKKRVQKIDSFIKKVNDIMERLIVVKKNELVLDTQVLSTLFEVFIVKKAENRNLLKEMSIYNENQDFLKICNKYSKFNNPNMNSSLVSGLFKKDVSELLNDSLVSEYRRLHNTLFERTSIRQNGGLKSGRKVPENFDEGVFYESIKKYQMNSLIQQIQKEISGNKRMLKKEDIECFQIIRRHYKTNVAPNVENEITENYYLKHIHNYMLGRARKIRKLVEQKKIKKYVDLDSKIFEQSVIEKKIKTSLANKILLNTTKEAAIEGISSEYCTNYQSILLQQKKLLDTFKIKLFNVVHNSVYMGLASITDSRDVFGEGTLQKVQKIIEGISSGQLKNPIFNNLSDVEKEDILAYFKDNSIMGVHIYGTYFIRNYTMHNQKLNSRIDNWQRIYRENLSKELKTSMSTEKESLTQYEFERFKFNNVLSYYTEEEIKKILNQKYFIRTEVKNSALPRFDKIFNKLPSIKIIDRSENSQVLQALRFYLQNFYEGMFSDYIDGKKNTEDIVNLYEQRISNQYGEYNSENNHSKSLKNCLELGIYEYRRYIMALAGSDEKKITDAQKKIIRLVRDVFEIVCGNLGIDLAVKQEELTSTEQMPEQMLKELLAERIKVTEMTVSQMGLFPLAIYSCSKLSTMTNQNLLVQAIERFLTLEASLRKKYIGWKIPYEEIFNSLLKREGIDLSFCELKKQLLIIKKKILADIKIRKFLSIETLKEENGVKVKRIENKLFNSIKATSNENTKTSDWYSLANVTYRKQENDIQIWHQGSTETFNGTKLIPRSFILEEYKQRTLDFDIQAHEYAMKEAELKYDVILSELEKYYTENAGKMVIDAYHQERKELYQHFDELTQEKATRLEEINNKINAYNFYSNIVTYNQLKKNKQFFESYYTRYYSWNRAAEMIFNQQKKESLNELAKQISIATDIPAKEIADKLKTIRNRTAHLNDFQSRKKDYASVEQIQTDYEEIFNQYLVKKRNETSMVEEKILKKFNVRKQTKNEEIVFEGLSKELTKKWTLPLISIQERKYLAALYRFNQNMNVRNL